MLHCDIRFQVNIQFEMIELVGGIYASKRRIWGLALAGSICALVGGH
jgi:hypothetical protein